MWTLILPVSDVLKNPKHEYRESRTTIVIKLYQLLKKTSNLLNYLFKIYY